ncbi:MAG: single-stranded DNA-binding protein [Dehalococcoidia bacterium]
MASLNKVMLIGNVGRDAELRYLANGTAQASFSLAVNRVSRGQEGDRREETEWFNIVLWRELAERVAQYVTKGKSVYVEGRLQSRSWDDDQGQRHTRVEVHAAALQLLGGPGGGGGGAGGGSNWGDDASFPSSGGGARGGARQAPGFRAPAGGDIDPDDLPFE